MLSIESKSMERLRIATYQEIGEVNLEPIHQAILNEPTLLHPSLDVLKQSFQDNKAIVMLDGQEPVGFARLVNLVDDGLKKRLGLGSDFPNINEVGSAVIINKPEYRGNGYYGDLRNALLQIKQQEIITGELLVVGTTKNIAVVRVLPKSAKLGINFQTCHHSEYPMVSPFTCICSGDFGQGYQLSSSCNSRISESYCQVNGKINLMPIDPDGKIACIMYISSVQVASRANRLLQGAFGTQERLVNALCEVSYYD